MTATHDHPHAHDAPMGYYERLALAAYELLVEKGALSPEAVANAIQAMEGRTPDNGARVVARAWTDPAFKERLLHDANAACLELGLDLKPMRLLVVESTPGVHNMIVCTLCSCYPLMLMGTPPAWYKSKSYRARAVREPRAVLREFGVELADGVTVRVHDSTADMRYMVIPVRPPGSEGMSEAELAALVSRDAMIGTAVLPPVAR